MTRKIAMFGTTAIAAVMLVAAPSIAAPTSPSAPPTYTTPQTPTNQMPENNAMSPASPMSSQSSMSGKSAVALSSVQDPKTALAQASVQDSSGTQVGQVQSVETSASGKALKVDITLHTTTGAGKTVAIPASKLRFDQDAHVLKARLTQSEIEALKPSSGTPNPM